MQATFEELLKDPFNELVKQAVDNGRVPIGYTCSYAPKVLLSAGNLFPLRMRAPGVEVTETADIYLSGVNCFYTRSLLELALDDRYDFLGGWVFTASCNHLHRLYDNVAHLLKPDFLHILDLPHKAGNPALKWYVEELRNLTDRLSDHFDVDLGEEALARAIDFHNRLQALLQSIGDCLRQPHPPLSGTEFHRLMMAAETTPRDLLYDSLVALRDSLEEREGIRDFRARLMIAGAHLDDPAYIEVIESLGGLVVADLMCTGLLTEPNTIEREKDPLTDIAAHGLKRTSCPRMIEDFKTRVRTLIEKAEEFSVDGIVIQYIKFCDLWGIEKGPLVSALHEAGIPVLCLEREYKLTGVGQMRTRVQAFLESMGR